MIRCNRIGSLGDALHAIACAAGYNIRRLMRATLRLGLKELFAPSILWLWVTLNVRWGAYKQSARRSTQIAVSPACKYQSLWVGTSAI